jgi:tRNA threonylcarbamoyladenosine biosynthesis protein TsaB
MALLLCIDSSTTHASVAVAKDGILLGIKTNTTQKDHASFLQPAIHTLLQELELTVKQLEAVAVTTGPGSYTGLRVGLASAKGLCFALNIPLIGIHTTQVISAAARKSIPEKDGFIFCPMVDARRMEVFTALYFPDLKEMSPITSKVLTVDSFQELLELQPVYFIGDGCVKWQDICTNRNARFIATNWNSGDMIELSEQLFNAKQFLSLAYSAPDYGKGFHAVNQ